VAVPRRYGPAIKTYAFFRTCPGREAVKLPVISPAGPCGPRGGVDPSVGATRQASPVARPEPHGRTHSLFTMSKNTPQAKAGAMRQPDRPVANGDLRTMVRGLQAFGCRSLDRPAPHRRGGDGGARRDRTDDLMLAKHALSRLSYCPRVWETLGGSARHMTGGPGKTRTSDLTLIKRAL
jgi:hypothetical protein